MKKYLHYTLLLFVMVVIAACSGKKSGEREPGTVVVSSNLENLGWMNQQTLSKDLAHSGKFSCKLDSQNEFSFGFSNAFNSLSDTMPVSVDVSVWVYFPLLKIKSSIVMSIDSVSKNIFWKGLPINDSIKKPMQWQEIKATFEIPKKALLTDNLKIYVWNPDKATFYMDDLKLLFHNQ